MFEFASRMPYGESLPEGHEAQFNLLYVVFSLAVQRLYSAPSCSFGVALV